MYLCVLVDIDSVTLRRLVWIRARKYHYFLFQILKCPLPTARRCWYTLPSFLPCSGAGRDEGNVEQHPPAGTIMYTQCIQAEPENHSSIAGGCTVCAVSEGIVQGHKYRLDLNH